jgi:bacteriocin biosynthesis cyclodehydratase domain-containing protein
MANPSPRRPILALPFTVLTETDTVRLLAGEDFRYTLKAPGLEQWLPGILKQCDGRQSLDNLLAGLDPQVQSSARQLMDRLYGERVLIDGVASRAHTRQAYQLAVEGTGRLATILADLVGHETKETKPLVVFCQDRLDYAAALEFNRRCLGEDTPWLWATYGPLSRGYISPAFFPDAGPCLACLLRHFQRLSPAPEIYEALIAHEEKGGTIQSVSFPEEGVLILKSLVLWKLHQLDQPEPSSALYRLHVLEIDRMEVTTHRVYRDPECPDCSRGVGRSNRSAQRSSRRFH